MADLVTRFLAAADSRDTSALLAHLTKEVRWTFGNQSTVIGHAAVQNALTPFFEHVVEMSHATVGRWHCEECIVVALQVRYKDRFGRRFEFPACNLFFPEAELLREVRVFVDNHELFLPC